ncbi:hypothetical protein, partial [Paenarthrobacter aurescens]|uniref:hypothetical protein n=1 Tax=Paenarthrobacter aurescens TaxID=43663 RepID=UPI0021BFF038
FRCFAVLICGFFLVVGGLGVWWWFVGGFVVVLIFPFCVGFFFSFFKKNKIGVFFLFLPFCFWVLVLGLGGFFCFYLSGWS